MLVSLGRKTLTPAEKLLQELGVTEPNDIDLEAIAWHRGVTVKYRPLKGCEARIVGYDNKAVISIHTEGTPTRKRYSLAHELGHWEHHRGQSVICRTDDIYGKNAASIIERVANRYAADLLMPGYLFDPFSQDLKALNTSTVIKVSEKFFVSKHAAAIRLVERSTQAVMLVCHVPNGRKSFSKSPTAPSSWALHSNLDPRSSAMEILFGNRADDPQPRKVAADAWFDGRRAQYFEIREQTFRTFDQEILTMLFLDDQRMVGE
jgi:Zn-dependent peptidase ImmA (M78 family)